jgi:hypothetical protein
MIVTIIGVIHFIHSPLLILFPFVIKNFILDIFYVIYFFIIMFLYTFIDGECPISYMCKLINDKNYIAGTNITYYPEMDCIIPNKTYINYYFGIMTFMYILTLFFVIFRTNIFSYFLTSTFIILFIYFLLIRNIFSIKNRINFIIFQEFTKYVLLIAICFLLTFILV